MKPTSTSSRLHPAFTRPLSVADLRLSFLAAPTLSPTAPLLSHATRRYRRRKQPTSVAFARRTNLAAPDCLPQSRLTPSATSNTSLRRFPPLLLYLSKAGTSRAPLTAAILRATTAMGRKRRSICELLLCTPTLNRRLPRPSSRPSVSSGILHLLEDRPRGTTNSPGALTLPPKSVRLLNQSPPPRPSPSPLRWRPPCPLSLLWEPRRPISPQGRRRTKRRRGGRSRIEQGWRRRRRRLFPLRHLRRTRSLRTLKVHPRLLLNQLLRRR